ncbi:large subunit ribosomal protein L22 [Desulfurella multipotens]|uniref:Large ribosomal subunit protein uL22 n=1 Tax=Desulfurella multipotens TaxID=79269 RepID=A0A1G6KGB1_9BACT|nr:50S ribosomal protein L22 [Desulfurella multipotens]SDC30003.1 large subunit ribosomal protein L22 [Desulfurella multipotens]
MEHTVKLSRARISPIKVRQVLGLIKGKKASEAISILKLMPKKSALILSKLIESAVAGCLEKGEDPNKFYIKTVCADDGIRFKRYRPMAMGRAGRILKRTTNIKLVLAKEVDFGSKG